MIRPITIQAEVEALAVACGLPSVTDTGEPHLERMNAVGWGKPLRGVFLLEPIDEHTVEGHAIVRPEARGREAISAGRDLVSFLERHSIKLVINTTRRDSRIFARLCGVEIGEM